MQKAIYSKLIFISNALKGKNISKFLMISIPNMALSYFITKYILLKERSKLKYYKKHDPRVNDSSRVIINFSKKVITDIIKDPSMKSELIALIPKLLKDQQTTDSVIELLIKAVKNELFVNDAIELGK